MREEIEIISPTAGKPMTILIEEKEWVNFDDVDMTTKEFILCYGYIMTFTRNVETGEINLVYFDDARVD